MCVTYLKEYCFTAALDKLSQMSFETSANLRKSLAGRCC